MLSHLSLFHDAGMPYAKESTTLLITSNSLIPVYDIVKSFKHTAA